MTEQEKLIKLFHTILKRMKKEWNHQIQGISHSQYLILSSLNHSGPQKAAQLAELTQNTPGAITSATDKLVSEGYAMRKGDEGDRRVVYLEITDKGRELANSLSEALNEVTMNFFQGLPEEDIQHLIRIYNKISENLDQCKG
ncbi:MarR family transcriptional regulator [Anoxybacterium hadale]|uniref:MarR family transcriptional regulator n=1 Tax=Anoxybacterium hadale TaxID=3408580 RepID=A0ACD1A6I8_9FIRM|nr:MarR family transcriptional regulator [Clostridiales bacterium]